MDKVILKQGSMVHLNGMPFQLLYDTEVIGNLSNVPLTILSEKDVKKVEKCQYCGQDRLPVNSHDMFCNNSHGER